MLHVPHPKLTEGLSANERHKYLLYPNSAARVIWTTQRYRPARARQGSSCKVVCFPVYMRQTPITMVPKEHHRESEFQLLSNKQRLRSSSHLATGTATRKCELLVGGLEGTREYAVTYSTRSKVPRTLVRDKVPEDLREEELSSCSEKENNVGKTQTLNTPFLNQYKQRPLPWDPGA